MIRWTLHRGAKGTVDCHYVYSTLLSLLDVFVKGVGVGFNEGVGGAWERHEWGSVTSAVFSEVREGALLVISTTNSSTTVIIGGNRASPCVWSPACYS